MRAVILAAGKGTRMGPLTENRPKAMLPIANKPLLEHIIINLKEAGIVDMFVVVGFCKEKIIDYFGKKELGINIKYVMQEEQKGTAHALSTVAEAIDGRYLVLNGDALVSSQDIKNMCNSKGDAVIAVKEVSNPQKYGVLDIKDSKVKKIIEKPREPESNIVSAGMYVFEPSIFDAIAKTKISPRREYEITDFIQNLIDTGKEVIASPITEWCDIGYPWDLIEANEKQLKSIKSQINGEIEPYATLKGEISVGKFTHIRNGAYIIGPVVIGENCEIGPNCLIQSFTSIGDNVKIGNAVEVKNSIIMSRTNIRHLSYVGDSIIGENCNFGAGTKVGNLRFDERPIKVHIAGKTLDSGRRKLGTIMGDNVHTGINSSIGVGTIILSGTRIMPNEYFKHKP